MIIHPRTKTFNTLVITSGIFLIALGFYKLFIEKSFLQQSSNLPVIATISDINNDVRIRKSFLFNWKNLFGEQFGLQNGDYVFTNKNSSARIFTTKNQGRDKNNEIILNDQALIKIQNNNTFEISQGDIKINLSSGSKPLNIKFNNKKYSVSTDTKASISFINKGKSLNVIGGDVSLKSKNITKKISTGQKVSLTNKSAQAKEIAIEAIYPVDELVFTPHPKDQIVFKVQGFTQDHQIQLAQTSSFQNSKYYSNLTIPLKNGSYYWRVINKKNKLKSRSINFSLIRKINAPKLVTPDNNYTYISYINQPNISFRWNAVTNIRKSASYLFELSNKNKKPIKYEEIKINSLNLSSLHFKTDIGQEKFFYWRTKVNNNLTVSDYSTYNRLIIKRADYNELKPNIIELKKPGQSVEFQWNKTKKAVIFQYTKDPSFENQVVTKKINDSKYKTVLPELGTYYWRVTDQKGSNNNIKPVKVIIRPIPAPTKPTLPKKIKVKIRKRSSNLHKKIKRKLTSFINLFFTPTYAQNNSKEKFEAIIKISPIETAKNYTIEIFESIEATKPLNIITNTKPEFIWKNPPKKGNYFIKMSYQDFWGRNSPQSDFTSVEIIPYKNQLLKRKIPTSSKRKVSKAAKPKSTKKSKKQRLVSKKNDSNENISTSSKRPHLSISLMPSLVDYTNENTSNLIKIDGAAINSYQISYHGLAGTKYYYDLKFDSSVGEVFNEQEFNYKELSSNFGPTWSWRGITPSLSVLFIRAPAYTVSNNTVGFNKSVNTLKLGMNFNFQQNIGNFHQLLADAAFVSIGGFGVKLSLNHRYHLNSRFSWQSGISFQTRSLDLDETDYKYQSFQILTGLIYNLSH